MKTARNIPGTDPYIPTLNGMGYMSPTLDIIQKGFVEHCIHNKFGRFLDIGCGFGVATLPVLLEDCPVVACDLERRHLETLKEHVPLEKSSLLTLKEGHFPNDIKFSENEFDGINMSMVLHFMSPSTIETALKEIYFSLKKGGRFFLTTSSPFQRTLIPFLPIYENKRLKDEWPGDIPDISVYVPQRAHILPKRNIVFCFCVLSRLVSKFGFIVQEAIFFTRDEIPADLSLDGREYSGIICSKPMDSSFVFLEKKSEVLPTHAANIR